MPTLEWIGKNKVVNHHQEVPFRVLERQYSFDEQGQHTENNDSENMIIHGDNLEAAEKWGLTPRRVNYYCAGGRISGAVKMAGVWLIPKTAEKPIDGRTKQGRCRKHETI